MRISRNFLQSGLERWQDIAEALNTIIREEGEITINDPRIWQGYLHSWNNEDWLLVLNAVEGLLEQHPELFKSYHEDAFISARDVLTKHFNTHDRVLDKKPYKRHAWKMIMTLREIWNRCHDRYIPNGTATRTTNVNRSKL